LSAGEKTDENNNTSITNYLTLNEFDHTDAAGDKPSIRFYAKNKMNISSGEKIWMQCSNVEISNSSESSTRENYIILENEGSYKYEEPGGGTIEVTGPFTRVYSYG